MSELVWNWLAIPYLACAVALVVVVIVVALIKGDRVMRMGMMGAAISALPWALLSAMVCCTQDPAAATRMLRLGNGPVAFIGPNLMLVMLGVSGQLERNRWLPRVAGLLAVALMGVCWGTPWIVPSAHRLSSGVYYISAGPLTWFHISQLGIWLGIGLFVARRTSTVAEDRRRLTQLLLAILICGAIGASDLLLVYDVWGSYPFAWLPCLFACGVGLYLSLRTPLLRSQGFDRGVFYEVIAFAGGSVLIAYLAIVVPGATPLAYAVGGALIWVATLALAWGVARRRVVRAPDDQRVAQLADLDDEHALVSRLSALWKEKAAVTLRAVWRIDGAQVDGPGTWTLAPDVAAWLSEYGELLVAGDLATMRLGPMRVELEAACRASLLVPLIDRGALVGVVEAELPKVLREQDRGMIAESARAVARALTYVGMARDAAREGETTREVEVAAAMRQQASASRDDDFGRWTVAAEYRAAPRTTGAGWSVSLLDDGRLAVLVTEAHVQGLPAALASSALVGAFAAATSGTTELDELLQHLRASSAGAKSAGEQVGAFLAILDGERNKIDWACAGHPGAYIVGPVAHDVDLAQGSMSGPRPTPLALGGDGAAGASLAIATRGSTKLPPDALVLIASSGLRGDDRNGWQRTLRDLVPTGPKLGMQLVEHAAKRELDEDLLAVVVRLRPQRSSLIQIA